MKGSPADEQVTRGMSLRMTDEDYNRVLRVQEQLQKKRLRKKKRQHGALL